MTKLMKQVCKDTHEFTPFQMRAKHPDAFVCIFTICEQNPFLSELRTILIANMGGQFMFYLHNHASSNSRS